MHPTIVLWQDDTSVLLLNRYICQGLSLISGSVVIIQVLISCLLGALIIIFLRLLTKGEVGSVHIGWHV
jgi:hypothetical protein